MATTPGPVPQQPAGTGGDADATGGSVAAGRADPDLAAAPSGSERHHELVTELVRMRREAAAEEDEEDLAWFSGVREEVLDAMASRTDQTPPAPAGT